MAASLMLVGALGCAPQDRQEAIDLLATAAAPQADVPAAHALGWIEGRLTAGAGEPAGRTIQVARSQPLAVAEGTSDAEGRFRVPNLAPGRHAVYLLSEEAPWIYDAALLVEVHGGRGTSLLLEGQPRTARVELLVTADGRPRVNTKVWIELQSSAKPVLVEGRTDEEGYLFVELPAGGDIGVFIDDIRSGPGESFFVPDGTSTPIHLELPMGVLAGRLQTHDGRSAPHAVVRIGSWDPQKWRSAHTDEEGRFRFDYVAPGRYVIHGGGTMIESGGFDRSLPEPETHVYGHAHGEPFLLATGEHRTDLLVELPAPVFVRGKIKMPDGGLPPSDLYLVAVPSDPEYALPVARAQLDGIRYRLDGLTPGPYDLYGWSESKTSSMLSREILVTEAGGQVFDLEFLPIE